VNTAKGRLEEKEEELLAHIENNGRMIRRQDKLIVDLQQKNDVSQTAIIQTSEDAMKKLKEKNAL